MATTAVSSAALLANTKRRKSEKKLINYLKKELKAKKRGGR
jgi:hypothetical protein